MAEPPKHSSPPSFDDFAELVGKYLDGDVSPAEFERLSTQLERDPQCRDLFVDTCLQGQLIADQNDLAGALPVESLRREPAVSKRTLRRRGWRLGVAAGLILCVSLAAAAALITLRGEDPVREPIAALVWSDGPVRFDGRPVDVGDRLTTGLLDLRAGEVQIHFFCGTTIRLAGPARFELRSLERGFLHEGRMAAKVPSETANFTVSAPGLAVVDLGTEFALNIAADGHAEVHVYEGAVEASLLGDDGATFKSLLMAGASSARLDVRSKELSEVPLEVTRFVRVQPIALPVLPLSRAYVEAVLESGPLGYWRFEEIRDGQIPNEVSDRYPLRVVGDVTLRGGERNRVAVFPSGVADYLPGKGGVPTALDDRYLVVEEPLESVGAESYSIELWVNPEAYKLASLAALVVPTRSPQNRIHHVALLELQGLSARYLHPPGAVRYLHRWPPSDAGGTNTFSSENYTPCLWQHLVAVKDGAEMSLYVNGRLVRRVELKETSDPGLYQLVLAKLAPDGDQGTRYLVGLLDEVAIYERPLSADEVRQHFEKALGD